MKKGGWVSEVLHASAQQEVVRYGLAVRAQELEVNPRVPAGSTEGRLFRELDRLARRDEHDAHLYGMVVLVRTTDRVVVVSEDDLRVDSGQAQPAAQADRRACVVAGSNRDVGRRERQDHEARIRGEDALDAASEEDLIGHRVPARVHELNPDEGVAASPAQYGLLRDREALPGWNQHGRGRRRLDVLVRPLHVVLERHLDAESRQRELTREGDRRSGGVVAPGRGRVDVDGDRHRDVRAHRLLPDRVTRRRDGRRKAPRHEGHGKRRQPEAEHDQAHYGYSVVDVSPPPSGRPDPGIRDKGLGPAVNTQGPRVLLTPKLSRAKISRAWVRSTFDS